jgi:hypothetical protein
MRHTEDRRPSAHQAAQPWSPEKNSLAAFFAANDDFAKKVIIVEKDTPLVIDLLEKIGF